MGGARKRTANRKGGSFLCEIALDGGNQDISCHHPVLGGEALGEIVGMDAVIAAALKKSQQEMRRIPVVDAALVRNRKEF